MPENPFLEALKASVGLARAAFDAADKDLHEAVKEADQAVRQISGGKLSVGLDIRDDGVEGRTYDLDLVDGGTYAQTVAAFFLSQNGYPMAFGRDTKADGSLIRQGEFANEAELRAYLLALMSSPDSPLTVGLAYRLRVPSSGKGST